MTPDQAPTRLPEYGAYRRLDARFLTAACWADLLGGAVSPAAAPPPIGRLFSRPWGRFTTPPAIPARRLPSGASRHFGAAADGLVHLGFGWATPQSVGCAIDGGFATLLLTPEAPTLRLVCRAEAAGALEITARPQGAGWTARLSPGAATAIDVAVGPGQPLELVLRAGGTVMLERIESLG